MKLTLTPEEATKFIVEGLATEYGISAHDSIEVDIGDGTVPLKEVCNGMVITINRK